MPNRISAWSAAAWRSSATAPWRRDTMASSRIDTSPFGPHDNSYVRNASRSVRSGSVRAARVQSMLNSANFAGAANGTTFFMLPLPRDPRDEQHAAQEGEVPVEEPASAPRGLHLATKPVHGRAEPVPVVGLLHPIVAKETHGEPDHAHEPRRVGVTVEAEHALLVCRDDLEVEAGVPQQRDVTAERSHRDAEAAPVVRDGHRLATSE